MCSEIGNEALRFQFLSDDSRLTDREKKAVLSVLVEKHYREKAIILIDEYDVPIEKANEQGYYEEMVLLIRNMFEQGLKTNNSLY